MRKSMNKKLRYVLAIIWGTSISVFVWYQIVFSHPIFMQLGASSLIAPIAASLFGGFIVAWVSPSHEVRISTAVGFILFLPMLVFLLRNGFSHFSRNPFFWYWPIYITPFFCLGGFLGRRVSRHT